MQARLAFQNKHFVRRFVNSGREALFYRYVYTNCACFNLIPGKQLAKQPGQGTSLIISFIYYHYHLLFLPSVKTHGVVFRRPVDYKLTNVKAKPATCILADHRSKLHLSRNHSLMRIDSGKPFFCRKYYILLLHVHA